jgi:hypothetical protein
MPSSIEVIMGKHKMPPMKHGKSVADPDETPPSEEEEPRGGSDGEGGEPDGDEAPEGEGEDDGYGEGPDGDEMAALHTLADVCGVSTDDMPHFEHALKTYVHACIEKAMKEDEEGEGGEGGEGEGEEGEEPEPDEGEEPPAEE